MRGSINTFAEAVRRVPGLDLVDEEELELDENDKAPVAYLIVPDVQALRNLESLWRRWLNGQLVSGETPWRDVFELLRDLRPWGPEDRVQAHDVGILEEEIEGRAPNDLVRFEIELVFRSNAGARRERKEEVQRAVQAQGGRIISASSIPDIAYDALLVDLPVVAVLRIIEHSPDGIAGLEPVMHIRPQSLASSIEVSEVVDSGAAPEIPPLSNPILALVDGVPIAAHPFLAAHLVIDDQFGLEPSTPVAERVHGTAMASLIVHGDRNRPTIALPRRVHVVPVLGARDGFPSDRLIVDLVYTTIVAMRDGAEPTAPDVVIVNLSLGNPRHVSMGRSPPGRACLIV